MPTQQIPNPQVPPQQAQYSIPPGASQPTQIYQSQQPTQHQPVVRLFDFSSLKNFNFQIDQSNVPTPQPSLSQNIQPPNPYTQQPAPTGQQQPEKRKKTPLAIIDPVSHKTVELPTQANSSAPTSTNSSTTTTTAETRPTETTTDSIIVNPKPTNDTNKTQVQTDFRHQIAKLLSDTSNPPIDKVYSRD